MQLLTAGFKLNICILIFVLCRKKISVQLCLPGLHWHTLGWQNHAKVKIVRVAANIFATFSARFVVKSGICCFLENSKFFCIFNDENTLFSKSAKKLSSFRKKHIYIFPILGGGADD